MERLVAIDERLDEVLAVECPSGCAPATDNDSSIRISCPGRSASTSTPKMGRVVLARY
jgi:hypothetical protein